MKGAFEVSKMACLGGGKLSHDILGGGAPNFRGANANFTSNNDFPEYKITKYKHFIKGVRNRTICTGLYVLYVPAVTVISQ